MLTQPDVLEALSHAVAHVKSRYPLKIPAYVILPEHLHVLWHPPQHGDNFSMRWGLIKHSVSCRVPGYGKIWQNRFWEHLIRGEEDYNRHLDYIHINPVKHGLVARPNDWPHSSFTHYLAKGWYRPDWGVALPDFNGNFGE